MWPCFDTTPLLYLLYLNYHQLQCEISDVDKQFTIHHISLPLWQVRVWHLSQAFLAPPCADYGVSVQSAAFYSLRKLYTEWKYSWQSICNDTMLCSCFRQFIAMHAHVVDKKPRVAQCDVKYCTSTFLPLTLITPFPCIHWFSWKKKYCMIWTLMDT